MTNGTAALRVLKEIQRRRKRTVLDDMGDPMIVERDHMIIIHLRDGLSWKVGAYVLKETEGFVSFWPIVPDKNQQVISKTTEIYIPFSSITFVEVRWLDADADA